jgi:GH15 family glucan-1,4-alpha-glucosidase
MDRPSPLPLFLDPVADPVIADYGAIGDCRTLALVSRFGSIDWWCVPDFSSPSCFAALLDRERGGRFALTPRGIESADQRYLPASNVLCTRFNCRGGVLEVIDFMTVPQAGGATEEEGAPHEIVRIARCTEGAVELQALFQPRPDYARQQPALLPQGHGRWCCAANGFAAQLSTSLPMAHGTPAILSAVVPMRGGQQHVALLHTGPNMGSTPASIGSDAEDRLAATLGWWRGWCGRCIYQGDYSEAVMRSALALKLLTHRPTGAVVAAGTTSLPEGESGARNWDYRYCWLRDTSLVLHAFTDIGYGAESDAFLRWLLHATRRTRPRLQVLYDVHGGTRLEERVLPHLRGYHGIGPVRIGNAASHQVQHDAYGEVILTACDDIEAGGELDQHEKELVAGFTRLVCDIWREPDHGIWEIRLPPRHNTHSKLMCWVALDRALMLHRDRGLPIDPQRVGRERAAIRADIEAHGYDERVGSYVGYYGSEAADASLLLMPRLGYIGANEPRMRGTVDHIMRQLSVDGLLYRYPPGEAYDGVSGTEHLFAICSFWCVDCLARQGRLDEACVMYERLLGLRNHVGLFAEEFGIPDGRPMGNFPQAFSHVGSITAALSLARARGARSRRRPLV